MGSDGDLSIDGELLRSGTLYSASIILSPWLILGDQYDARDEAMLTACGVTHVVNAAHGTLGNPTYSNLSITYCPFDSNSQVWDSVDRDMTDVFDLAIPFIEQARSTGGRVFVHCHAGISRSSTVVLAYLMQTKGWSLSTAYAVCKQRRWKIDPNRGFLRQLIEMDGRLKQKRSAVVPRGLWPSLMSMLVDHYPFEFDFSETMASFSTDTIKKELSQALINGYSYWGVSWRSVFQERWALVFRAAWSRGLLTRQDIRMIFSMIPEDFVSLRGMQGHATIVELLENVRQVGEYSVPDIIVHEIIGILEQRLGISIRRALPEME